MHQVLENLSGPLAAEVTADCPGGRGRGVGGASQRPKALDHTLPLRNYRQGRTGEHELHERFIERLPHVLVVVLGKQLRGGGTQFDRNQRIPFSFDAAQNFSRQTAFDAIGLDQDESAFRHRRQPSVGGARFPTSGTIEPVITLSDFDTYPDFPVPGVLFYDISPILANPTLFAEVCTAMTPDHQVDIVVGVDARGFIFAPVIAQSLNVGMSMVRKKGKMPGELLESNAAIEYGASDLVLSANGITHKRVLVVDDVLATGGTASAVGDMLNRAGAASIEFAFLLELEELNGRAALQGFPVTSVVQVPSAVEPGNSPGTSVRSATPRQ